MQRNRAKSSAKGSTVAQRAKGHTGSLAASHEGAGVGSSAVWTVAIAHNTKLMVSVSSDPGGLKVWRHSEGSFSLARPRFEPPRPNFDEFDFYCAAFQPPFRNRDADTVAWLAGGCKEVGHGKPMEAVVLVCWEKDNVLHHSEMLLPTGKSGAPLLGEICVIEFIKQSVPGTVAVLADSRGGFVLWHDIPQLWSSGSLSPTHLLSHHVLSLPSPWGHVGAVRGVAFLPSEFAHDGDVFPRVHRFVTVSSDQSVKVWQAQPEGDKQPRKEEGAKAFSLVKLQVMTHRGMVRAVCFHAGLGVLFTASDHDGIKGWRAHAVSPDLNNDPNGERGDKGDGEGEGEGKGEGEGEKDKEGDKESKARWLFVRRTVFSLLVEIEEPCGALSVHGQLLFSAHGRRVMVWDIHTLHTLTHRLQPSSGSLMPSASVVGLPNALHFGSHTTWLKEGGGIDAATQYCLAPPGQSVVLSARDAGQAGGGVAQALGVCDPGDAAFALSDAAVLRADDEETVITHVAFANADQAKSSAGELQELFESVPWVCGLYLATIARLQHHGPLTASTRHVLDTLVAACKRTRQVFLAPDSSCAWEEDEGRKPVDDGLVCALRNGNAPLVEFVLFELLQPVWLTRSLAHVFTVDHLTLLIQHYPHLVKPFLCPAGAEGVVSELCLERSPPTVLFGVDRKPRGNYLVHGSFGLEPHGYWKEIEQQHHTKYTTYNHRDVACFRVGIRGVVQGSRRVLRAADHVRNLDTRQSLFSLNTLDAVIRYQVHGERANIAFFLFLALHCVSVLAMSSFSLYVDHPVGLSSRDRWNGSALAVWLVAVNLFWLDREMKQLWDAGGWHYLSDPWNWVGGPITITTLVIVANFFLQRDGMLTLTSVTVVLYWFKTVYYLRIFQAFAFLIRALFQIVRDLKAFFAIMLLTACGFANAFHLLYLRNDAITWDAYEVDFRSKGNSILSAFAMTLGGIDIKPIRDAYHNEATLMVMFVVYMLVVFVVMLNVVIAIITQTFGQMENSKLIQFRAERASMVVAFRRRHLRLLRVPVYWLLARLRSPSPRLCWLQILTAANEFGGGSIVDNRQFSNADTASFSLPPHAGDANNDERKGGQQEEDEGEGEGEEGKEEEGKGGEGGGEGRAAVVVGRGVAVGEEGGGTKRLATRWLKQARGNLKGLKELASFDLVPAPVRLSVCSLESGVYEVEQMDTHPFLSHLDEIGVLSTGQFSSPTPLGSHMASRAQLHIPPTAAFVCVSYPLGGADHLDDQTKHNLARVDGSFTLLLFGGLLTFDATKTKITSAHSFLPGGRAMAFASREVWRSEYTAVLKAMRRFRRVTIKALRDQGAEWFAWVRPGEVLRSKDGFAWCDWQFGAFVYLFDKETASAPGFGGDCYFRVQGNCLVGRTLHQPSAKDFGRVWLEQAFARKAEGGHEANPDE